MFQHSGRTILLMAFSISQHKQRKGTLCVCDFLAVNNTNLYPILHCFQNMAYYWSNFCCWWGCLFL